MSRPHALIIGGSLGGLFAANLLRASGWDVTVYERARSDLAGRGAGLGTRDELFAVLRRIGVNLDDSIGVDVRSRICLDSDGGVVCELPIRTVATAWDRVYYALRSALPSEFYRAGMQLEFFEQDAGKVAASFADGSRVGGDLLVAADGINSTVRNQLLPESKPGYAGYVAWRGMATDDDVPAAFHEQIFHHMNFCLPEGELALALPMPAGNSGGHSPRRCQFSWFRPVDHATGLPQLCTDASGHCHGVSIPPPMIRPELIQEIKAQADAMLAPQLAEVIAAAPQPILQPIFDLATPQIVFGRAVLLGDAAFVARPHVGTGVTKAALDAQFLADTLLTANGDIDAALARYGSERRRFGDWLVARGRYLGAYLTAQQKPREQRRGRELYRQPEIFMREFGGAGVIDGAPADGWHP
jgi:2-polyprenyl-6-methoxyphenol hydroxylase-like FAD-dependent oxidoreductase